MSVPKTRAAVPAPRNKSFLPTEGAKVAPATNMSKERLAPMTFNMPIDWHRRFKMAAVQEGINMKDLLFQCFEAWLREQHQMARGSFDQSDR